MSNDTQVRNWSPAAAGWILVEAVPYRAYVQSVGLASTEVPYPPSRFKAVYTAAGVLGMHRVAHAGMEMISAGTSIHADCLGEFIESSGFTALKGVGTDCGCSSAAMPSASRLSC